MTLKLENLTKRFGNHTAVNQLNLEIPEKEMFGFLGGNGAGKTTTFRMILGLINKTEGNITWNGQPIGYDLKERIGYLPEERGLYPKLKVREQVLYLGKLKGLAPKETLSRLTYWLDRFKVPEYLDKKVEQLSKGNQQKIQFISAVIHNPSLLILDEPFSGLDPINVEMLKEAVVDLRDKGTSIVFSSHQMSHVEELCENVCILQKGSPVVQGALKDIKRSFGKKNLYIQADFPLAFLEEVEGVVMYKEHADGVRLQISNESNAENIFGLLQNKGFVRQFSLEEPSLNDIFIEKAGESYE